MSSVAPSCVFCGTDFPVAPPSDPAPGARRAFDPWQGRLWNVCPRCQRWSPVPLELRWEVLEAYERAVADRGKIRLTTEHLSLVRVGEGELVRVGPAPRVELAGWRYGDRMPRPGRGQGFLRRLFGGLPPPPLTGYRPYGLGYADPPVEWVMSPFQDAAWGLTLAFTSVPLAPRCPSCHRPLALAPWAFHEVRLSTQHGEVAIRAHCALCDTDVTVPAHVARPALRLGLSMLSRRGAPVARAESAAAGIDILGGAQRFAEDLGRRSVALGDLDSDERLGLSMVLDEAAEAEALEAEWREAEEVAAIMDGELSDVPGFEAFRQEVLALGGGGTL